MTEALSTTWQQLASEALDEPHKPGLRVSSSGKCPRALAYSAQNIPVTNPPDQHSMNRMALGHMAEILIIKDLQTAGWETAHTILSPSGQLELDVELPAAGVSLTGHPDGICRHPDFTKNKWVTLECKSMSVSRALKTEEQDVIQLYPQYLAQITLYARRLHDIGLVSSPNKGVFAMMDRDGRPLPPERVSWKPKTFNDTIANLEGLLRQIEAGELPDRPYPPTSFDCRYCDYHNLCRGPRTDNDEPANGQKATILSDDPDVNAAAIEWAQMKPRLDHVKNILQDASDQAGKIDIIAQGITAGYFQPRKPPVYDPNELARLVPADILRECLAPRQDKREGFWIRKS